MILKIKPFSRALKKTMLLGSYTHNVIFKDQFNNFELIAEVKLN